LAASPAVTTGSMMVGSSSPSPVRSTRLSTIHSRNALQRQAAAPQGRPRLRARSRNRPPEAAPAYDRGRLRGVPKRSRTCEPRTVFIAEQIVRTSRQPSPWAGTHASAGTHPLTVRCIGTKQEQAMRQTDGAMNATHRRDDPNVPELLKALADMRDRLTRTSIDVRPYGTAYLPSIW